MASDPVIVFCMAGLYRRFRSAGYTIPKYLLDFRGFPILTRVAEPLKSLHPFILIANRRDESFEGVIRLALPGNDAILHFVGDTRGQAETAAIGASLALQSGFDRPILFHNVDTIIEARRPGEIGKCLLDTAGAIDIFESKSADYSYVQVVNNLVVDIAEKKVISPYATSGLYGFHSPSTYLKYYEGVGASAGAEQYISDVYKRLLADQAPIAALLPQPGYRTHVLGTPEQYVALTTGQDSMS